MSRSFSRSAVIGTALTAIVGIAAAIPAISASAAAPAGDAAAGKAVFARCGICHATTPGTVKMGPSLAGVVGRKAGTLTGFTYSPAMKSSGLTWTPKDLDAYLTAPSKVVPGTKMIFPGLPSATDRQNVIAYLATLPAK